MSTDTRDLIERLEIHANAKSATRRTVADDFDREVFIKAASELRRLQGEVEELQDTAHYANGTAELAMKHRDEAESQLSEARELLERLIDSHASPGDIKRAIFDTQAHLAKEQPQPSQEKV